MKRVSLFWPLILIAVGGLWLLGNMNVISPDNLWALTSLWPVLLIGLGIGLILRSRWPFTWNIISFLTIAVIVLGVIFAPQLGLTSRDRGWFGWTGPVVRSGEEVTENRQVSGFDAIKVSIAGDVTIEQGEVESVMITADKNIIGDIKTEVRGGTLYVETTPGLHLFNWPGPVQVTIQVKDLRSLVFSGAGEIQVKDLKTTSLDLVVSGAGNVVLDNLAADQLKSTLSGAGNITANGKVADQEIQISGVGSYKGADLQSDNLTIRISGAGSADVWAKETLVARISGVGSVNYFGDPHIEKEISGAGSINKKGNK